MNRLAAAILLSIMILSGVAEVSAQESRLRVFNWRGENLEYERDGDLGTTRLTEFWCMSDSLVVTADLAERRENEVSGKDDFFLRGNVVAEEGATRITGERGKYDRFSDVATVAGSVLIIDGETEITCDEADYDRTGQLIHLRGEVEINQPGARLNADRMVYHRETGFAEAWGAVELEDIENRTLLAGEHGSYDRESGEAMMDRNPSLFQAEAGDSIRVTAALMRQFGRDSVSVAVGDVRYLRGTTEALCDSAVYYRDEDRLLLFGEPRMIRSGSVLSGDSLDLRFVDGEVDHMRVAGDARFQGEPADARVFPGERSEITGDRFDIEFEGGDIRQVAVQGNPRSLYIPEVEEGGRASVNEAHGDSMLLRFEHDDLDEVRIFGTAQGSYRYLDDWEADLVPPDSLRGRTELPEFEDLAQVINYRARDIIYHAAAERAYLEGEAEVESPDFTLRAKTIRFDSRDDFLDARGEPLLIDRGDELYGRLMEYDIDEKVGLVHEGATRYGEGFYTGERLKKRPGDLVHAHSCGYTTCDLEDPHFHFRVDRMTIRPGDKIVGAPVRFYLGDIPLFYLPFLFNDLGRGRHSGFLQPDFEFGISLDENKPQRFIRDLGYYWALGDYADATLRGNFEENRSLFGSLSYRFYRRYFMGGAVRSSFTYDVKRDLISDAFHWGLTGTHSQNFGERSKLNATVDFASSESLLDIDNYTVEQVIDQKLSTNLSFSRKWDNLSLNTSYSRTQYLNREDDDPETDKVLVSESTPLSLSATPIPLFPGLAAQDGFSGALGKLKFTPRLSYSRKRDTKESGHSTTESASTGTSFGLSFKLGVINVRPSVGASENWNRSSVPVAESVLVPFGKPDDPQGGTPLSPLGESGDLDSGELLVQQGGEFSHRWNASTAISTRFYGLFYPRIGKLTGIRHTVAPSASWNYSESRGKSFSLSRRVGLTLDNSIDLKFGEGEEVRRQSGLLTWNLSTGYDLEKTREENPWSTLSSSVQFNPLRNFSLSLRQSFDPNRSEKLSTTISGNLSLSGQIEYGHVEKAEQLRNIVTRREGNAPAAADTLEADFLDEGDGDDFDPNAPLAESAATQPGESHSWNLSSSFSLNRTRSGSPSPTVNLRGGIALTENWALDYRTSLSLDSGNMGAQTIRLTRDLHCWAASFSRVVFQDREQYYLRIYLKAHAQDIKIESGDRSAGYGGY
jgi:lipopolysaccharide assembly outer membrane protein LptD (OstA)